MTKEAFDKIMSGLQDVRDGNYTVVSPQWTPENHGGSLRYCATGDCMNEARWRLEAGGVGSSYCGACMQKIQAVRLSK